MLTIIVVGEQLLALGFLLLTLSGDIEPNPGPNNAMSYLSICHINIQSLSELKLAAIGNHIAELYDVITLSETFLNVNISFPLDITGFQAIFRKDRPDRAGGGVAVYVSDRIPAKRRSDLDLADVEMLWLELRVSSGKLLLGTCYQLHFGTPFNTH